MKAYVILGKYGDIASALPMLIAISQRTGKKPVVVVAKKYADLVEDCPMVTADVWGGEWFDLREALKYAKQKYREVVCLSTFGEKFPIEHRFQGFQLDQWDRGGMLNDFGELPLVLLNNPTGHDVRGCILLADASESSRFEKIDELERLIQEACPDRRVVRLSTIKVARMSELVSIYNDAAALVTIDTAHLHLSAASRVPVLAFSTDKPTTWHGSAHQDRFWFHCRYADFERRKGEFMQQLSLAVKGGGRPITKTISQLPQGAYNPSIISDGDGYIMAFRHHPAGTAKTEIGIAELDKDFVVKSCLPLEAPKGISDLSVEDPRLFRFGGKMQMSYTLARLTAPPFRCVCGFGGIEKSDGKWALISPKTPKYGRNDFSGMEKNWIFFESDGRLYADYGGGIVLELDGEKVVKEHKSECLKWGYGVPHGGAIIPWKGGFLRFYHARTDDADRPNWWYYRVGVATMESKPPFRWTSINPHPIISGDEGFRSGKFWKPKVSFPSGCVAHGGQIHLSWGHNDSACKITTFEETDLT